MHHPADRGGRDIELAARRGKAAAARCGLERLEAVEEEEPSQITLRKTDAEAKITPFAPKVQAGHQCCIINEVA